MNAVNMMRYGATTFGAMWRKMIRLLEEPAARAASTYGITRIESAAARTTRATRGTIGIAAWDVSMYRSDLTGELLQFTVGPDIPASTFNADRTIHQGIEAGLTLNPAPWLRLRQVYQYSDFRFDGDAQFGDNRLPVIPMHLWRGEMRLGTDAQ